MAKRVSIAVCLSLGAALVVGVACSSIPDSRKLQPTGYEPDGSIGSGGKGGSNPDAGNSGGTTGSSGGAVGTGGVASGGLTGSGNGTGSGGVTGSGGTVGSGGVTGSGGTAGGDAGLGPATKCGSLECYDRFVGSTTFPACCAGDAKNKCGLQVVTLGATYCVEPNQNGKPNSACPAQYPDDDNSNPPSLTGCCRPGVNSCGLYLNPVGGPNFGCVDPTEVGVTQTATCTPPTCSGAGKVCTTNDNCCTGKGGNGACVTFSGQDTSECTSFCTTNRDCNSGCCVLLTSGRGACAPDASACSAACRVQDETCDVDADCCIGNVCAPQGTSGPSVCRPKCTTNTDCKGEFCVKDSTGRGTCSATGTGLCLDTCLGVTKDGTCNDGGPGADFSSNYCALGTDCTDCGPRAGGFQVCSDSCGSAHTNNGACEDGGTKATSAACPLGTDCTDCGPRLGLCANDCPYHDDGACDDGSPGSEDALCEVGSDCDDCGATLGARNQTPCDGTAGYICQQSVEAIGEQFSDVADGTCDCSGECPWDAIDCKGTVGVVNKCDGKAISACCAPGNPCKLENDGLCECGGWCDWEKDCGSPPRCDGATVDPSYCVYKPTPSGEPDGFCDCSGYCSWDGVAACPVSQYGTCKDTCANHIDNGICEDGGPGASTPTACALGTDCADCGPR